MNKKSTKVIEALKQCLKQANLSYADVAKRLDVSEAAIKRNFSIKKFSLERIIEICDLMNMELADVLKHMDESSRHSKTLTIKQEQALVDNPELLLVAFLLFSRVMPAEIVDTYDLSEQKLQHLLIKLERLEIIRQLPDERIKILIKNEIPWINNGPLDRFMQKNVEREFFLSDFESQGELKLILNNIISLESISHLQNKMKLLAQEFNHVSFQDNESSGRTRYGASMVLAIRPWELSLFKKYKRN